MSRATLKPAFEKLETDILETFMDGCVKVDGYPKSHSDVQGGIRALLKRFDIKARPIPLDWADLFAPATEDERGAPTR